MNWIDIGAIDADNRYWQFSQPFNGNLIKLKNEISEIPNLTSNFRGLLGLYVDGNFFAIQEIFSIPESQLFLFNNENIPQTFTQIAIRNISRYNKPNQWTIKIWGWDSYITNIIGYNNIISAINNIPISINQNIENNQILAQNIASEVIRQNQLTNQQVVTEILTFFTGGV